MDSPENRTAFSCLEAIFDTISGKRRLSPAITNVLTMETLHQGKSALRDLIWNVPRRWLRKFSLDLAGVMMSQFISVCTYNTAVARAYYNDQGTEFK